MTRILTIIALLFTTPAWAGLFDKVFGYSSYEDCILGELTEKTGDRAARYIRQACRDKFPRAVPTGPTLSLKPKKHGRFKTLHSFMRNRELTMKLKNTTGKKVTHVEMRLDAFPKGKKPKCSYSDSVEVASWQMTVADGETIQLSQPLWQYFEKDKAYEYCYWVEGFTTVLE